MEQIKAMNALEPFLALTKSASSPRAAADLIQRATSAPNTFIFAELLQAPQIQALSSSPDHSNFLALLKIFSYGTYSEYKSTSGLPSLNEAQTVKLRQLSFLSLAKNQADLTYARLLPALGLETPRQLEDLVISAIYAGLVSATLDPYHQLVAVTSVAPLRDLQPNSIPSMLTTLDEWSTRCNSTLADLEKQIASIKAVAKKRQQEEEEWSKHVETLVDSKSGSLSSTAGHTLAPMEEKEKKGLLNLAGFRNKLGAGAASKRGSGGLDDGDENAMEVDDEDDEGGEKRGSRAAKKRGVGGHLNLR